MSRAQFRLLIVFNQLLILASIPVGEISDKSLPSELRSYLGIDQSVLNIQITSVTPLTNVPYWVGTLLLFTGVIASIGMCYGKRWGRTLFLLTFVMALLSTLLTDFYVNTGWSTFVGYLAEITEGMILGLAYFSHVRRMFENSEEISPA